MQLFGWTLHSCWMLLTVISVCCCVDIGSSTEINEEVMEEQPWIWNEFKLAGAARKFHSILDNGGSDDEDNDNNAVAISDRAAAVSGPSRASIPSAARPSAIFATASNFRDNQQQEEEEEEESQQQKQQEQQQQRAGAMTADSPNVLDDYDVYEDRPLMKYALMADGEPAQYYGKLTSNLKRSQQPAPFNPVTGKRRQKQQQQQQRNSMTLSSKSSTGGADAESSVASQQQSSSSSSSSSLAAANIGRDSEPRVLPLLGFHSAVNKINRQKESLLKKILRQAARRQSMKRSPNCMRKCIAQGLLHPAQCHSLC